MRLLKYFSKTEEFTQKTSAQRFQCHLLWSQPVLLRLNFHTSPMTSHSVTDRMSQTPHSIIPIWFFVPRYKESLDALQEHYYLATQRQSAPLPPKWPELQIQLLPLPPSLPFLSKLSFHTADLLADGFSAHTSLPSQSLHAIIRHSHNHPWDHPLPLSFPLYNIYESLLCNSSYFLLYNSWALTTITLIPFFLLIFCQKLLINCTSYPYAASRKSSPFSLHPFSLQPSIFFQPLPLFQCKHTGASLLDTSSSTNPAQHSDNADIALQGWLEICWFSSHPIISPLAFTLCNHNLEIFCLG